MVAVYFAYRMQMPCPDCGEAVVLDGPRLAATCAACHSLHELDATTWKNLLSFRQFAPEFALTEGRTRGSSLTSGELRILVRWGPGRPACAACSSVLAVDSVPVGGEGTLACGCGQSMPTFPVPAWLAQVAPSAVQVFGAARETSVERVPLELAASSAVRPVLFSCPQCGANLKVGHDASRILTCGFCDSDIYLPDPLWRSLHPVKKRTPWWVRFDE